MKEGLQDTARVHWCSSSISLSTKEGSVYRLSVLKVLADIQC